MAPAIGNVLATMQLVCNIVMPEIPVLPDGYLSYPDINTAYKVHTDAVTWDVARERCLKEDAHLAVIDTTLKISYVMNQEPATDEVLVGIRSVFNGTKWISDTEGWTLPNLPWSQNEPSGGPTLDIVSVSKVTRRLANHGRIFTANFVCEIPITMNLCGEYERRIVPLVELTAL